MNVSLGRLAGLVLTAFALTAVLVVPLSAEIYRWVDENGVTHFSDRKPEGGGGGTAEIVDPSKSGSLTVIDEGENKYSPASFIKELSSLETGKDNRKRNIVEIYTTPT